VHAGIAHQPCQIERRVDGINRQAELQMLSDWIDTRFKDKFVEDHDLIVMGDFNTPKLTDPIFGALASHGLKVPKPLVQLTVGDRAIGGSNLGNDARYGQILHLPTIPENFTNRGGALDFFINDAHIDELFPGKKVQPGKIHIPNVRSPTPLDPNQDRHRRLPPQPNCAGRKGLRDEHRSSLLNGAK
jgi:hypothetical protein